MNKKILIVSILAVFTLLAISFATAIKTTTPVKKKESPLYKIRIRRAIREKIGDFIEVYVKAPIEICEERDVKGLYARARAGEIKNFTGIDDPYEHPLDPEVVCETDKESIEESVKKVLTKMKELGYINHL